MTYRTLALGMVAAATLAGCVSGPRETFTADQAAIARPPGFGVVSYRLDEPSYVQLVQRTFHPEPGEGLNALALSGGGANGAYGAGLLNGLTRAGQRPAFGVVTGISTGALIAPFAFLGPQWDDALHEAFTGDQAQHLLQSRGPLILFGAGLYSRQPLKRLVERYVTQALLAAVAEERRKGRLLLVATTDLDDDKLVVWDMGAIAQQGGDRARALFVDVLVASACIPGVFEPTLIEMQSQGRVFREMHVDGSIESDFFAVPQTLMLQQASEPPPYDIRLYILINGGVNSDPQVIPEGLLPVLERTVAVATRAALRSLLIATFEYSRSPKHTLYIASLPGPALDDPLDFSAAHLQRLYEEGFKEAIAGAAWRKAP